MKRVLYVRQDNNGDVLLQGPAIRAIAKDADLTLLCGPRGVAAARLLPGIEDIIVNEAAWIDAEPRRVDREAVQTFVEAIAARAFDEGIVSTSFHQSPLPAALLLRMAGIERIGAISVDYAGSLLDVRHHVDDDIHEVVRALSLARAMGHDVGGDDPLRMRLLPLCEQRKVPFTSYIVVHPGATVPARAWSAERNTTLVDRLAQDGYNVVVTGSPEEVPLATSVAGWHPNVFNAAGKTTFEEFAAIIRDALAVICGNTSATHVASAVGTPLVELFPPTIPAERFHPWMVPHVLLGDQQAPCRGCRSRICPLEDQPCLAVVSIDDVIEALQTLVPVVREVA